MKAEPLGAATYKITLDKTEAQALPVGNSRQEMKLFIHELLDRLTQDHNILLPEGRLLVEAFLRSDGSLVLFVSPLDAEQAHKKLRYYACDITGVEQLRSLCCALSPLNAQCNIYCGSAPDRYRLIFTDPSCDMQRICSEYGEYCEVSALFAAQTEEYLTAIAQGSGAGIISKILG